MASALGTTINTGINGENLAITYNSTGNTVLAHAGSYAITGVVSDGSGLAGNYTVTLSPGTLTVTPATLAGNIGNAAHVYGSTVDLASALGTTINTGINGENLAITYSSTGNTVLANAGSYAITGVVSDGSGLAANYTVILSPGTLTVTPATLTGNATTQNSLNLSKQGALSITVSNVAGLLNGDTLAAVLSTAEYFITVGTHQYAFVPTTATTFDSSITISYVLKNSSLVTQLAASTSGTVRAGLRIESLNYTFIDDDMTRLVSAVKPSPAIGKRPLLD